MGQIGNGIFFIGILQVAAAFYFLPRTVYRSTTWAKMYRYPLGWTDEEQEPRPTTRAEGDRE